MLITGKKENFFKLFTIKMIILLLNSSKTIKIGPYLNIGFSNSKLRSKTQDLILKFLFLFLINFIFFINHSLFDFSWSISDLCYNFNWCFFFFFTAFFHFDICFCICHFVSNARLIMTSDPVFFGLNFLFFLLDDIRFNLWIINQIDMFHQLIFNISPLFFFMGFHSFIEHPLLPCTLNLINPFHSLYCFDHQFTIVARRNISSLLKIKYRITCHLFSMSSSVCFGPFKLSWVLLGFEKFIALTTAESKLFWVISDKHHTVSRVYAFRTEITLVNSHFC